jgi:hypothetical protein
MKLYHDDISSKLLMGTAKRDISAVETSFELSSLPLYRSSHTFQNLSLTGARILKNNGLTVTKSTPLDKYLSRSEDDISSWYSFPLQNLDMNHLIKTPEVCQTMKYHRL